MNRFRKISEKQFQLDQCHLKYRYEDIKLPKRATTNSAGYDIFSLTDFTLAPKESILLPTGIKAELDSNKFLMIVPRSGQGFRCKLQLYNTVGIIDSDYYNNSSNEGHIWVKLYNDSPENQTLTVEKGGAICQAILLHYMMMDDEPRPVETREGGFGSTSN